jgi:hypothetical protein
VQVAIVVVVPTDWEEYSIRKGPKTKIGHGVRNFSQRRRDLRIGERSLSGAGPAKFVPKSVRAVSGSAHNR